ncbi:C-type lectin domain-containing protein [Agitococcus lubricus]|uniref:Lectin-like protein n=1 Tax=Agitococcus lubricus TaxID=1077255 RepID=A0A2T5IW88_9GAMM|nr:lectin-like protein [Agitococcus lubricus]PTQ88146.1 lectin-like protein [Agitococcus lubricus]
MRLSKSLHAIPTLKLALSSCLALSIAACNNNDESSSNLAATLAQKTPLAGEPMVVAGTSTKVPHYAKMGPLQQATIAVYDPMDQGVALAKGTTGADGSFQLTLLKPLPELRPLILRAEGGTDIDPDDNPSTANTPIANQGFLHAIVFAEDLLGNNSIIISPVTELVYQRLEAMIGTLSPLELRQALDDMAAQLLNSDINGNTITNYQDVLAFNPSDMSMHNKLYVPFSKYHSPLASGKSFIEALRENDAAKSNYAAELLGASAPNINIQETNIANNVKLDIYVSGDGTLESGLFKTGTRRNSEGIYKIAVPRSLKEEYALTVKPDAGRKIVSWVGCSSISTDRTTCLVKPDQSKSVYAVLAAEPLFKPEVKSHTNIPLNSDVVISDNAGIMTISTRNAAMGAGLAQLSNGVIMSLPYLPHPLIKITEMVSVNKLDSGTEVQFKFIDQQVTDVLNRASFYSTPEFKPQIGLDDIISVTMINDKTILKDPKVSVTDSNFENSTANTNSQTGIVPKYRDRSGGKHLVKKAWELVIHKNKCVIYADETPPTTPPVIPNDPKNDTVWTSALRAADGECHNKTLIYKPYNQYARDFNLAAKSNTDGTNANHAQFANMRYMQHMDPKTLANTPLYLISGNKKQGETMRTAAAWTWAEGVGPVLKIRNNVFLARKSDGRSGFELLSFEKHRKPQGELYTVADFKCKQGTRCSLKDAELPKMRTYKQATANPWYFGPNDPIPSPYKNAVDVNNLYNLLGSDGLALDLPFKRFPWLSVGIGAKLGFGMSVDYFFDYSILDAMAAFKLIPEVAVEPRLELNLKAGKNTSDWKKKDTEKPKLELTMLRFNIGYPVLGPVASILRPDVTLNAGIEFGGEAKIYAAYTRGVKAKMGVDAYYNADLVWDGCCLPETRVDKRLDFPRGFETYKSQFELGIEGQLYAEPYLEMRLEGSVTGVGENLANVALRGFLNANIGFEAGVAVAPINKPGDQVNEDIDRIANEYKTRIGQELVYQEQLTARGCLSKSTWELLSCLNQANSYARSFASTTSLDTELAKYNKSIADAPTEVVEAQAAKMHSLYDKNYGGDFVDKVLDGSYNKSTKVSCKFGLKLGLDAGYRATATINTKNIKFVGDWIGEEMSLTLFEQRWPVKLQFIDDFNEKLAECEEADKPEPDDTAEEGTNTITWQTNSATGNQYALILCGSWDDCQAQANQVGAHLVTIGSEAENKWVSDKFVPNGNKSAWIGLNDKDQEGDFKWDTEEELNYTNWNSGEPNNVNNEDVVSMIGGGKWNDNSTEDDSVNRAVIERSKDILDWKLNNQNSKAYVVVECGNWQQCQDKARTMGANLATISNADENKWLVDNMLNGKSAWIGFNDIQQEGNFKWISGETTNYSNWNSGEPNNAGNEDAVVMLSNGRWNDDAVTNNNVGRAIFERLQPNWKFNATTKNSYAIIDCGSWLDCQAKAQSVGANLVTINDQDEQTWLHDNFPSTTKYWIGLTDKDQEGNWKWISGETPSYTNWNFGEPNNVGDEDYAETVENGRWNDAMLSNTTISKAVIEK